MPQKRVGLVCNMNNARSLATLCHMSLSRITLAAIIVAEVVFILAYDVQRKLKTLPEISSPNSVGHARTSIHEVF